MSTYEARGAVVLGAVVLHGAHQGHLGGSDDDQRQRHGQAVPLEQAAVEHGRARLRTTSRKTSANRVEGAVGGDWKPVPPPARSLRAPMIVNATLPLRQGVRVMGPHLPPHGAGDLGAVAEGVGRLGQDAADGGHHSPAGVDQLRLAVRLHLRRFRIALTRAGGYRERSSARTASTGEREGVSAMRCCARGIDWVVPAGDAPSPVKDVPGSGTRRAERGEGAQGMRRSRARRTWSGSEPRDRGS